MPALLELVWSHVVKNMFGFSLELSPQLLLIYYACHRDENIPAFILGSQDPDHQGPWPTSVLPVPMECER